MVYKVYRKKGGKLFGPYYYESYRDGNHIRKIYIGDENEYKIWSRKNEKPVEQPKFRIGGDSFSKIDKKKVFLFAVLLLFVILIGFAVVYSPYFLKIANKNFTGFVIAENISEEFNSSGADLQIKQPPKILGHAISKNQNKRMDFNTKDGNIILYFDLLNYSEFVENVINETNINLKEAVNNPEIINEVGSAVENVSDNFAGGNLSEDNNTVQIVPENTFIIDNESNNTSEGNLTQEPSITGSAVKRFFGFVGRVIGLDNSSFENNTSEVNNISNESFVNISEKVVSQVVDISEMTKKLNSLNQSKINEIAQKSKIEAENFDIKVDESKLQNKNPEYKWGYRVKLNDLKFMAKIDITSNKTITVYNNDTLRIGRNLVSFNDLAKAGYKVKIEMPALEIPVNISVENQSIKVVKTENITNITSINVTEANITISNQTVGNVSNESIENETGGEGANVSVGNESIENETGGENLNVSIGNESGNVLQNNTINQTGESIGVGENKSLESGEQNKTEETKNITEQPVEEQKNEQTPSETEPVQSTEQETPVPEANAVNEEPQASAPSETTNLPAPEIGVTGEVVRIAFGITGGIIAFTGRVTGRIIENAGESEDIRYDNNVVIYIEKDFSNYQDTGKQNSAGYEDLDNSGNVSVGDIIELDPTLSIIPATGAEHLDSNRSFIEDVYDYIKALDNNWSSIPAGDYIRVTFSKALASKNDITIYARSENNCLINSNGTIIINGNEIPCDIYLKKKRIDELKKILFTNFLSLQFLILMFIPKKLKIRGLLNQS